MGSFTKFIGRLLFVSLLVSLAYVHITKPQNYIEGFKTNYNHVVDFAHQHIKGLPQLPSSSQINWNLWIQIYGAFQGFIALSILAGDGLGGFLLFLTLIIPGAIKFCDIESICKWKFAQFALFVGASLAFMCSSCNKKLCKKTQA